MADLVIQVTDAGRAEIINAENTGTDKVLISEIGLGNGKNPSTASQTALQDEFKRLTTFGGTVVSPDTIHVSVKDTSSDDYDVHEIGLFTDKGVLLAVYSQATPILEKTATSIMLLAVDMVLQTLDAENITFGDIEFVNPPASETTPGVSRFATADEAEEGERIDLAVSPKRLKELQEKLQPLDETLSELSGLSVDEILSYLRLGEAAKRNGITAFVGSAGWLSFPVTYGATETAIIIQWGQGSISGPATPATINYPIPFPNACFQVSGGNAGSPLVSGAVAGPIVVDSTTLGRTSFQAQFASQANYSMLFRYIAIGY